MPDQADTLREMVRSQTDTSHATALLFTSGKGGVGTSNLCVNLAIALAEKDQRVVVVDADFGLANLDILCGLAPEHDLGDVLSEERSWAEAAIEGPGGVQLIAGAHGMRTLAGALEEGPDRLVAELRALRTNTDFLLIDGGSGLGTAVATLAPSVDQVVVVATPEPTAVADAHATLRHLRMTTRARVPRFRVVINQARSVKEAEGVQDRLVASSREFLGVVIAPLGHVRYDPHVAKAVRDRRPFLTRFPRSTAARCVRRLAETLVVECHPPSPSPGSIASRTTRRALRRVFARLE